MNLDEKLETVEKGLKSVNESLGPLLQTASTPTFQHNGDPNENTLMLRKHATLVAEWEAVQDESDVLREELKEDKWLTVFRTVTDQADGMMSSLEKAVNRCQVSCFTSSCSHSFDWWNPRNSYGKSIDAVEMTRVNRRLLYQLPSVMKGHLL